MTRLYLHLQDGDRFIFDEEGSEFADLHAARGEALEVLREMLADNLSAERPAHRTSIVIADARGHVLDTVPLALAKG